MRTFFIIFIIVFINNIYANDFFEDIGKGINQFFEDVGKLVSPDNPVEKYIKLKQTKGTKTEALKTAENEAIEFIEWHTKSLEDSYAYLAKLEYIYGTGNISAKEKNEIRRQEQYINYKNENLATMLKNLNSVLGNSTESENSDNLQNLREYISKTQEKLVNQHPIKKIRERLTEKSSLELQSMKINKYQKLRAIRKKPSLKY